MHDLLPVLLHAHARLRGHRRRSVEPERPAEAPRVLLLAAPVQQRAQRLAVAHDPGRVDGVERVRIARRDHRHLVVHLVDQPAHVARREVVELLVAGELVEVAREVDARGRRRAGSRRSRARRRATRRGSAPRTAAWRSPARPPARPRPAALRGRRRARNRPVPTRSARGSPGTGCTASAQRSHRTRLPR